MEYIVLNKEKEMCGVLDTYESMLWVERYYEVGDFELYTSVTMDMLTLLQIGFYIISRESRKAMIIEKIAIKTDIENGDKLIVTGRSLESILYRRIVWAQTTISGNIQNAIKRIVKDNITECTDTKRIIPDFIFEESNDTNVTSIELEESQYYGTSVYEVISTICMGNKIGFEIYFNDSRQFVFRLYAGADRSYLQSTNPYIIFSNKFDNLISANYNISLEEYKNVVLVTTEDNDVIYAAQVGDTEGFDRREMYVEASDITSEDADISTLLLSRGYEELLTYQGEKQFEAEVNPNSIFKFNRDYFLGDVAEIVDDYGHEETVRVTEYTISDSSSGFNAYPTLEIEEVEELDEEEDSE